jgi:hypothetical protein
MSTTREDVIHIAEDLHMKPTEEQIQSVINDFDSEAEQDPTGDWTLWIENLLFNLDVEQIVPPKNPFLKKLEDNFVKEEISRDEIEEFAKTNDFKITEHGETRIGEKLIVLERGCNYKKISFILSGNTGRGQRYRCANIL